MNVLEILNTIRENNSSFYQERIPEATAENLKDIGSQILAYQPLRNEFIDALLCKVAFTEVSNRKYSNPLAVLKSGTMPFGNTWEEVHTNPTTAKAFDRTDASGLLRREVGDTASIYHSKNRADEYIVDVSYEELQTAFTSLGEMSSFIQSKIDAMYSGDEIDEFGLMKNVITDGVTEGWVKSYDVDYDGKEETSKELIKLVKTLSNNFTFASKEYNGYNLKLAEEIEAGTKTGRITWTPKPNQVIFIRSDVDAATDVEVLAKAFNMEKVEFDKRKFVVDHFGDTETLVVLADDKFLKVKDNVYTIENFRNGHTLTTKYMLHHHQTISASLFANCVAIKKTASA